MYNSVAPINITYRKQGSQLQSKSAQQNEGQQVGSALDDGQNKRFPNGREVAIDYSKNKINIAQVVADFNSTVLAINAPQDIQEEVSAYLKLVTKESEKQKPSKEIVFSNLKNAAKISDKFIAQSLNKPSRVVEGWVDALSLQNIDLKYDAAHQNPDFKVQFPEKAPAAPAQKPVQNPVQNSIQNPVQTGTDVDTSSSAQFPIQSIPSATPAQETASSAPLRTPSSNFFAPLSSSPAAPTEKQEVTQTQRPRPIEPVIQVENTAPVVEEISTTAQIQKIAAPEPQIQNSRDTELKKIFSRAKKLEDPMGALKAFQDAADIAQETGNTKALAAAHFERGKIYDQTDSVDRALQEYNKAAEGDDLNIKAKAHIKMAEIYDDFAKFEPALGHYHRAVVFAGEANNLAGQSLALGGIATMYAERYDRENTIAFNGLTIDTALGTDSPKVIGRAYSTAAKNYNYISENTKSLDSYKKAVQAFGRTQESYEQMAKNYSEAAGVMQKLGNQAKAESLLAKSRLYQQKAQLG